jgi:transcription elongation factor GreB
MSGWTAPPRLPSTTTKEATMATAHTTPAGHRRLLQRLADSRARYEAICATNGDAADAGDNSVWHDNFAYEENQRQMHAAARAVRDLQRALQSVVIVQPPAHPDRVALGTTVVLEDQRGVLHRWSIAGFEDGDPTVGRVSYTAPLARALMGREPGDVVAWRLDGKPVELEVLSVTPTVEEVV